jgi:glyoxylate utilization-related uncharacterized protein
MVRIYRVEDSEKASRAGYEASYIADLTLFIAITEIRIIINDTRYDLKEGDVVFVEPGEAHSFETETDRTGRILALKFPNIKDDKVVPVARSQN